jgi:hypothetical protein
VRRNPVSTAVGLALAAPALHFLILGVLLVAGERWFFPGTPDEQPARASIEIGSERVDELRAGWVARTGEAPDSDALRALVDAEIDDEILLREARARDFDARDPVVRVRLARNLGFIEGDDERFARAGSTERVAEALALGIARSDLVVRRRLIERMRAELSASVGAKPDEAEIAARFVRDRERYVGSARVRLSHAFLARDRRGAALESDAQLLREQVAAEGLGIAGAIARGDAFLLGHSLPPRTEADLARVFGEAFARAVFALEPGQVSGPITSSYGLHLVVVHERIEAAPATLVAARTRVLAELVREREAAVLRTALDSLRVRYDIRVAGAGT